MALSNNGRNSLLTSVLAVAVGLLVLVFASLLSRSDPLAVLGTLAEGSIGTAPALLFTLSRTAPLLLTGLSVAIAFRAGLFNIGGEGQMYMGALFAAAAGAFLPWSLPGILHLVLVLLAGIVGGWLWGALAGWLRAYRGVHEVIATLMLNYIAIQVVAWFVDGPLTSGERLSRTRQLPDSGRLPVISSHGAAEVNLGLLVAVAVCIVFAWYLFRTRPGFEIRAMGANRIAARTGGIPVRRRTALVLGLAGALAGLAGAIEVAGVHGTLYSRFSPGYGYDGIAVALVAGNHPLGVIASGLFFGGLRSSENLLQARAVAPRETVLILQAVAVLVVACRTGVARRFADWFRRLAASSRGKPK